MEEKNKIEKIEEKKKKHFHDMFFIWAIWEILLFRRMNLNYQAIWLGVCLAIYNQRCQKTERIYAPKVYTKEDYKDWINTQFPGDRYRGALNPTNWNLWNLQNFFDGKAKYVSTSQKSTFDTRLLVMDIREKLGSDLSHIWEKAEDRERISKITVTDSWYQDVETYCQNNGIIPCERIVVYDLMKLMNYTYSTVNRQGIVPLSIYDTPMIRAYNSPQMLEKYGGWNKMQKYSILNGYILVPVSKNEKIAWFYVGPKYAKAITDPQKRIAYLGTDYATYSDIMDDVNLEIERLLSL